MGGDPGSADEVHLALTPDAGALAQARRFLGLYAQQSGLPEERVDDVVQAAAELVVLGGRVHPALGLVVREHPDRLSVLVDLAGSTVVDDTTDAVALLSGLSSRWGWNRLPGCTQVWCEVPKQRPQP